MNFPQLDLSSLDNLDLSAKLLIGFAIIVILLLLNGGDMFEHVKRRFLRK